nr:MAG TPA: hypothetical protein [Caudoviricetes sp.]
MAETAGKPLELRRLQRSWKRQTRMRDIIHTIKTS